MELGPTVLLTSSSTAVSNATKPSLMMVGSNSSNLPSQSLGIKPIVNKGELTKRNMSLLSVGSHNYIPVSTNSLLTIPFTIPEEPSRMCQVLRCNSQHRTLQSSDKMGIDLPAARHAASDTALRKYCTNPPEYKPTGLNNHSPPPCISYHPAALTSACTAFQRNQWTPILNGISDEKLCVPCPLLKQTMCSPHTEEDRPPCGLTNTGSNSERPSFPRKCTKDSEDVITHAHLPSRLGHSPSFNVFKPKRSNPGPNSNRRQSETTLGLDRHQSIDSTPSASVHVTTWGPNPIFGSVHPDNSFNSNNNNLSQRFALTIHSVTNGPQDGGGENQDLLPSGRVSIGQSSTSFTSGPPRQLKNYPLAQVVNINSPERSATHSDQVTVAPIHCMDTVENASSLITDPRSRTCCFCWCCCCSCSCMRVRASLQGSKRPSASNDAQSRMDEMNIDEKLTHEEVKSWGESFDLLMQCSAGRKVFREFLRSEYSDENIMFWLACEQLKQETNPELIEEKARMIYEDFISILSPREVSLDSRVREIINANMIEPTPHTFDEAQLQIYTLMHRDSYLRFLNSRMYKELLQQTTNSGSTSSLQ